MLTVVGAVAALLLIATALVVLALLVAVVAFAARRRWARSLRALSALGLVLALYAAALLGASLIAPHRTLRIGQWKCFDDWCASVTSAVRTGDTVQLSISVRNQGRRRQAPDTPRMWLIDDGRRDEVSVPGLASAIAGRFTVTLPPIALTASSTGRPMLLVTEGGFPSGLVIGDENSPFHPQRAWQLS
jgi:hypothetical protein